MAGKQPGYVAGYGSLSQQAVSQFLSDDFGLHNASTDTKITTNPGRRLITYTGGALSITLATPVAKTDDGKRIAIVNATSQQHTITATGILNNGSSNVNTATFAANAGGYLELVAYNAQWYVTSQQGVTFS